MGLVTLQHFRRAVADLAAHGDNDVTPFDIDTRFISDSSEQLAALGFDLAQRLEKKTAKDCESVLDAIQVFSERLLAPAGPSGFRITTKIHPFWNLYLNAIGVMIAEIHEPKRSTRAMSYRFATTGPGLFQSTASWRAFREASAADCSTTDPAQVVIQTDISSFYDHVSHHRLENFVRDLLPSSNYATQINTLLAQISQGRSFGLPVGGQFARILAEVLLGAIDRTLTTERVEWRRYVDDFVIVSRSKHDAYRSLGVLAHALGDFGLTLNRTKTTLLSARHFRELVATQLGTSTGEAGKLREIDLHFDPYSDSPEDDYDDLRETVAQLDIPRFLALELEKGQPDTFVITQVSRSLRFLDAERAFGICATLLDAKNLHAFRANWSSIMRGIFAIRNDTRYEGMHVRLDALLDTVPTESSHLVLIDTNALHFLRTIRFLRTDARANFLSSLYNTTKSITVRRACIDCWRQWGDRERFIALRNVWSSLNVEEQRMLWFAGSHFGDDGIHFQRQVRRSISQSWKLGIERRAAPSFCDLYLEWVAGATS
jgi:hypothetical protein